MSFYSKSVQERDCKPLPSSEQVKESSTTLLIVCNITHLFSSLMSCRLGIDGAAIHQTIKSTHRSLRQNKSILNK